MEQKTLLAIILSVAVLFSYEAIFAHKRPHPQNNSQTIENKEVVENKPSILPGGDVEQSKTKTTEFKEQTWDLNTTSNVLKTVNVGGALHYVKITQNHPLPLSEILSIKGYEQANFRLISQDPQKIVMSYEDGTRRITKVFEVVDENNIKVRMEISNLKSISRLENIEFNVIHIDTTKEDLSNKRETMLDEYSVLADKKMLRKGNAFKFTSKEDKTQMGEVEWVAFRDHFTAVVAHPEFKTKSFEIKSVTDKVLNISVQPQEVKTGVGESATYEFSIFMGPQDTSLMKKPGKGFEKIVAFSNFPPLNVIAMAIYYTIPIMHAIFRSWGVSIIMISLLIYGLTYPLTIKSMMSMKKMQQTQPKIKALQDRYKNDPTKLNAEIMEIYKREKINPLGGCLPFLLQMPIFIALYQALWRSYYFQGKSFLWIKDLAQPDRLFILPFQLPFLGNEFNILPILMAIVMFVQQKVSAKNTVVTDEQQATQQKMMMYFFPVFIGFIFYKFASGLSLYFTIFYLLSTLTQWKMSKVK